MAIATNHRMDASHMATTWEALALNRKYDSLTETTFASFRAALLKSTTTSSSESKSARTSTSVTPTKRPKAAVVSRPAFSNRIKSEFDNDDGVVMTTPEKRRKMNDDDNAMSTPPRNGRMGEVSTSSSSSAVVTPSTVSSSARKASSLPSYANRKNAGQTVVSYNPKNLPSSSSSTGASSSSEIKCTIDTQPYGTNVSGVYRHMTDRRRQVHLNTQLEEKMKEMVKLFNIPTQNMHGDDDFDNNNDGDGDGDENMNVDDKNAWPPLEYVGIPRPTPQTNIGRICNEAHTGKLNATSILLEGCFTGSHGARIELDISQLSNVSLFPGQIVAVAGYNSSGRRMVAQRLAEGTGMYLPENNGPKAKALVAEEEQEGIRKFVHETSLTKDLHHLQYGMEIGCQRGEPIQIMAVAGPYTTNDDTSYQPFIDLLEVITNKEQPSPPDVVILMGPFVDMRQKMVSEGTGLIIENEYEDGTSAQFHVSHEHFFAHKIAKELELLYEENPEFKTQFVIVPSMDDAVSEPM